MENFINRLVVRNFKSIQHIDIACKRVNVFIGEPNVGKSNVLEALALLGTEYCGGDLKKLIRFEKISDLFFGQDISRVIGVKTNRGDAYLGGIKDKGVLALYPGDFYPDRMYEKFAREYHVYFRHMLDSKQSVLKEPRRNLASIAVRNLKGYSIWSKEGYSSDDTQDVTGLIKKYDFKKGEEKNKTHERYLQPPFGDNLYDVIRGNREFHKECVQYFAKYNLNLVYRYPEGIFEVHKNQDGIISAYPYDNMADTLQRIIFYLAAIESNKGTVLVLEEPEAHAFPPYTKELASRIVLDDENQYFLTTHSPYLLHTFLEDLDEAELNLVLVYYEDHETKVRPLSKEEVRQAASYDFNIFFNLQKFLENGK